MRPTNLWTLLGSAVVTGIIGWLIFQTSYGSIISLPVYAIVVAGLLAVFEGILTKVVRERLHSSTGKGRQLHPIQVARAAALAKASSAAGALLAGLYAGFLIWCAPRSSRLPAASHDALVAGLSGLACLLLVIAALLLERVCRTPDRRD